MNDAGEFQEVLQSELEEIVRRRWKVHAKGGLTPEKITEETVRNELVGLALSGGGVRSGAASLGLLQTVHESKFLQDVDYLSTVSGGSYAGAFLSSDAVCNDREADEEQNGMASEQDSQTSSSSSTVTDEDSALSLSSPGNGRPSKRMLRFIFGGKYLRDTFGFLNRQFFGMILVLTVVVSGLVAVSALVAWLVRCLDYQMPRYFVRALGFETEIGLALIPAIFWFMAWLLMWGFAYLRRTSDRSRTGALVVFYVFIFFLMVGVANIIGTGDLFMGQGSTGSPSSFLHKTWGIIVAAIVASLLPYLAPKYLIQSGTKPRNSMEKYSFWIATNGLLFGLPFLFVGIMLQENISGVNDYRTGKIVGRSELKNWSRGVTWNPLWQQVAQNLADDKRKSDEKKLLPNEKLFPKGQAHETIVGNYALKADEVRAKGMELLDQNFPNSKAELIKALKQDYDTEFPWWPCISVTQPITKESDIHVADCFKALTKTSHKINALRAEPMINRWLCLLPFVFQNDNVSLSDHFEVLRDEGRIKNFLASWLGHQMSRPDFYKLVASKSFLKKLEQKRDQDDKKTGTDKKEAGADEGKSSDSKDKLGADEEKTRNSKETADDEETTDDEEKLTDAEKQAIKLIQQIDLIFASQVSGSADSPITIPEDTRGEIENLNREILVLLHSDSVQKTDVVKSFVCLPSDQNTRIFVGLFAFGIFLLSSVSVNLNATSCHSFYRNRLSKMWIETGHRRSPITMPLLDTTQRGFPYHLISGSMAYAGKFDRDRAPERIDHFLFSQKYCGSERAGFMPTNEYMKGEITLADAVAISGAAISVVHIRNALVMFLLFITNLRLGQWLENPRVVRKWKNRTFAKWQRFFAVTPMGLMINLFKNADDRPVVFVADGGHFENLAIDELLRRRCRLVVALDAGADPEYKMEDLTRLVRWARMKHGIELTPITSEQISDAKFVSQICANRWTSDEQHQGNHSNDDETQWSKKNYLMWKIRYPGSGENAHGPSTGTLVYIKNTMTGDEPLELIKYQRDNEDFPHDSTSDQFFDPGKFESYRLLGQYLGESVCADIRKRMSDGEFDKETLDCLELANNLIPLSDEILKPDDKESTARNIRTLLRRLIDARDWQCRKIRERLETLKEEMGDFLDRSVIEVLLEMHAIRRDEKVTLFAKNMLESAVHNIPQFLEILEDETTNSKEFSVTTPPDSDSKTTTLRRETLVWLVELLENQLDSDSDGDDSDRNSVVEALLKNLAELREIDEKSAATLEKKYSKPKRQRTTRRKN